MKREDKIQQECVMWFRNYVIKNKINPAPIIFHVPNQGKNAVEQIRKKNIGMLAGVSDLVVVFESKILFIEMKDDIGIQSDAQQEFEQKIKLLGFDYHVVRSLEEFQEIVKF